MRYEFSNFLIDTDTFELSRNSEVLAIEPQVFGVIVHLIENRTRIVTKDDLIDAVWGGRIVSDATLTTRINAARRALGDNGKKQAVIRTFPRRGFRFVADVGTDTETAPGGLLAGISDRPAIAVIPLINLSEQVEDDFIGDGICEDLATALSGVRLYRILSRSVTAKYRDRDANLSDLSAQIGAAYVISGSFRRAGQRLRINLQLEDTATGTQLWAQRFDSDYSEIFAVQDRVVQALVGQLEPELDQVGYRRAISVPESKLNAWELYHKAMILVAERKVDTTRKALDLFIRAVELDPQFSRAYAALTQVYSHLAVTTGEGVDGHEMLRAAALAAAGDSQDYWSQTALGIALMFSRNLPRSLKAHEAAIELNPHNAQTRAWYGVALISSGRAEDAIPQLELAIRLSPGDPWIGPFYGRLSRAHYFIGQIEEAISAAESAFNYDHAWPVHACYTACHIRNGMDILAAKAFENLISKQPSITSAFIRKYLPEWHEPYINALISDLRQVGLK